MPVVIKTKNGTAGAPPSLAVGELAVNTTSGILFVGATNGTVTQLNNPTSTTVDAGAVATPHLYWDQSNLKWVATSDIDVTGGIATLVNGTINGTTIGVTSAATGKFTTLEATGTLTATGGIIDSAIGETTPSTGAFTTLTTGTLTATGGINASAIGATTQSTGKFTTLEATQAATLVAGTINGTTIGALSASTGAFTTLTTSSTIIASGIIKGVWSNTGTANADSQFQVVTALPATPDTNIIYFVVP